MIINGANLKQYFKEEVMEKVKEKDKSKNADFISTNWYELWMKQSKEFFETADKNLKDLFGKNTSASPEDQLKQMQKWLEMWKGQWQCSPLTTQQKAFENYWKSMTKLCNDASEMMIKEWIKRSQDQNPIKNTRELYELWLSCCHDVYQKSTHSKDYQEAYGDFMNAALKFWQSTVPQK